MTRINRREGLALGASLALGTLAGSSPSSAAPLPPGPTLNAIAQTKRMRFGSSMCWADPGVDAASYNNPTYSSLVAYECGLIVPENELKWPVVQWSPTGYNFARFDGMLAFAQAHGLAVRGHNILWNQPQAMPAWLESYNFGANPATEAARVLTDHVNTYVKRYLTSIFEWDVVNEAVNPADGTLFSTALSRAMGGAIPAMDLAFHTAHAAAPSAKLVYNDYMCWEPGYEKHRAGVLSLLQGFRARGVPVHALGVQSHLVAQGTNIAAAVAAQTPAWRSFLNQVVAMGYSLVVTELDVRDTNLPADQITRDRAVADYAQAYLSMMMGYPQLTDVVVWGMVDKYSWLQTAIPRADHLPARPCPYNKDYYSKSFRAGIGRAFSLAKSR